MFAWDVHASGHHILFHWRLAETAVTGTLARGISTVIDIFLDFMATNGRVEYISSAGAASIGNACVLPSIGPGVCGNVVCPNNLLLIHGAR